jgi:hypothetical protein
MPENDTNTTVGWAFNQFNFCINLLQGDKFGNIEGTKLM